MNDYKKLIFIKWWNENHDEKITEDDVWISGDYIKDYSNGLYDVLSTNDVEELKNKRTDEYCDELKEQVEWILRQNNLKDVARYVLIDRKLVYDEFNQWDTRMLTDCKDWLAQEYPFEGELYDIIQI